MGNNIDDIFKKAIEPLYTEPSEEFWRKAAEDIIAKGSKATEQKVFRWRVTAFVLGAGLLILGYFTYRMKSTLEKTNQQIKVVENEGNKKTSELTANNVNKHEDKATLKPAASINIVTHSKQDIQITSSVSIPTENSPAKVNHRAVAIKKQQSQLTSFSDNVIVANSNAGENLLVKHKKSFISATHKPVKLIVAANQNNEMSASAVNNIIRNQQSDAPAQPKLYAFTSPASQTLDSIDNKDNIADTAEQANQTASNLPALSNPAQNNKLSVNDSLAKLRITTFFSPDYLIGYGFNSSNPIGAQIENTIKQGETEKFSYTIGAKAEYALSYNFSIGAGLAYEVYAFNINPCTIYAQKQSDGDVGYYFTTSSGVAECPSYGYTTVGQSILMNASSTRRYLELPLLAKYYIVNAKKLRLYAVAGLEPCFNLGDNIVMNWQNSWNEGGTVTVNSFEGSRNFYFSYYIGAGVTYKMGRYLSIYIEPGMHNAVTPIDDQIAVTTSPKLFSASVGLTYSVR